MTTNNTTQQKLLTTFVVLCVVAILTVGVDVTKKKPSTPTTAPTATSQPSIVTGTAPAGNYKDGSYMATGSYSSPSGKQTLAVSLIIAGGNVSEAMVTPSAKDGVAQVYQSYFVDNFKNLVIGKSVSNLKLSRVAGSSLTSKGFNDALTQIKKKAQS